MTKSTVQPLASLLTSLNLHWGSISDLFPLTQNSTIGWSGPKGPLRPPNWTAWRWRGILGQRQRAGDQATRLLGAPWRILWPRFLNCVSLPGKSGGGRHEAGGAAAPAHLRPASRCWHSAGSSSSMQKSPAAAALAPGPKPRQCAAGSSSAGFSLATCSVASTSSRVLLIAARGHEAAGLARENPAPVAPGTQG